MQLPHRLQGQKVKSQGHGAGAYCGGHLAAQLVVVVQRSSTVRRARLTNLSFYCICIVLCCIYLYIKVASLTSLTGLIKYSLLGWGDGSAGTGC